MATLTQDGCNWQYTDTCGHHCGTYVMKRTTCPVGQYVAGYGSFAYSSYGRYNPHILCCPVHLFFYPGYTCTEDSLDVASRSYGNLMYYDSGLFS